MKKLLAILTLFCWVSVQAQSPVIELGPKKFKVRKAIKQADKQVKLGNIYAASELYEQVLEKKPTQVKIAWQLAQSYQAARDYVKAEKWYGHVAETDADAYPEAGYYQALMMKMNGKYAEAQTLFNSFAKAYKGESAQFKKWAKTEAEGCSLALKEGQSGNGIKLIHLSDTVNSAYSDVSPIMWDKNTILFAALPEDSVLVIYPDSSTKPDHHIKFYSTQKGPNGYSPATKFPQFDKVGSHVANGAFSPDGKRFYFTICDEVSFTKINCKIYVSHSENGTWSEPVVLDNRINMEGYTNTQPAVGSNINNSEVLYFVSDRPGGKGGLDIWYSIIDKKGNYQEPKNAGKINSDRDEATPFYDNANGTLYFSSNGWVGLGGYDIFKVIGKINKWTPPENMGKAFNSSADDMYFSADKDQTKGFLVSNRVGVISLKSPTCCDDIFAFESTKDILVAVKGYVFDESNPGVPLNGAKVSLSLMSEGDDIPVNEQQMANDERYFFSLGLGNNYKVTGSMSGYLNRSAAFTTFQISESDTLVVDIFMKKLEKDKSYSIKNIYYDYNSAALRQESSASLDSLYTILIENPGISIELGSHTDARGSETYNINLSQKRAESVVKYLVGKGIALERLKARGYGETQLLADCSQLAQCPTEGEGDCPCHQQNRRTEFKIIDVKEVPNENEQ
ncbi:MAG: OmpA family protein [Chitinophagales bacterium]|nr:OmpA family protein [Chitinophagales bacterium]